MRPILFSEQFCADVLAIARLALASPTVIVEERTALIDVLAEVEHQFEGYPLGTAQQTHVKDLRYVGVALDQWRIEPGQLEEQHHLAGMLARVIGAMKPDTRPF